jgi:hypothetical protein
MACLFLTSPAVVLNAHFMGYLDHVVVLAVLAAVWLAGRGHSLGAGAVAAAAVLVHENGVALGMPLVAVAALWPRRGRGAPAPRLAGAAAIGLPLAAFAALLLSEQLWLDRSQVRAQMTAYLSGFPFIARDINIYLPEWLTTSGFEGLRTMGHAFGRRVLVPEFLWRMGAPALLLVAWAAGQVPAGGRVRAATAGGLVALAPLALHAGAWDTARIWGFPLIGAFAFAWWSSDALRSPSVKPPDRPWLLLLAVPMLASNLFGHSPLMDGETERFSAATRLWLYSPLIVGLLAVVADRLRTGFTARGGAAV